MLADYLRRGRVPGQTASRIDRFSGWCPLIAGSVTGRDHSDDKLLAQLFIHTWTLITGRMLRSDVPPHELTEQELIDFWADD